jgi:hypothetical protein
MVVYAVRDLLLGAECPLGEAADVFVRREDAERFIEDVLRDEPVLAKLLWIEPVELDPASAIAMESGPPKHEDPTERRVFESSSMPSHAMSQPNGDRHCRAAGRQTHVRVPHGRLPRVAVLAPLQAAPARRRMTAG